MSLGRILIADDEPNLREPLRILLERAGFAVIVTVDGQDAFETAVREQPDVIILDVMMPRLDGYEACRRLRSHYRTRHIPIIMLTAKATEEDHVMGLTGGANDYVSKPYKGKELVQRVKNHHEWAKTQRSVSPLTGLPGNNSIMAERQRRVDAGEAFGQLFLDLDNFKAFNDRYGFPVGDTAIQAVAEALVQVIETQGEHGDFVGHVGGDDFWVITRAGRAEEIAEAIKTALDLRMPQLYDDEDRARGAVRVLNRRHEFEDFPLMSVTIAVADYDPRSSVHLAQVDDVLKELKTYGKSLPGSVVVTERRRHSTAETPAPASPANDGPASTDGAATDADGAAPESAPARATPAARAVRGKKSSAA